MAPTISFLLLIYLALQFVNTVLAFPSHASLAGLSQSELDAIIPTLERRTPEPPPGPPTDTSSKLVVDPAHPFIPAKPTDIRGPCPGLNTLASHGVRWPLIGACVYLIIC